MHADEFDITVDLVAGLIAGQFPRWAGLPLRPVPSAGTVNAMFRLGEDLVVRLPRVAWGANDVVWEHRWLGRLAGCLPVAIPAVVAQGRPTREFPWAWGVRGWLAGQTPHAGGLVAPARLAADLAGFVTAMRAVDLADGPLAYRGGPLAGLDVQTRGAIAALGGLVDTGAVTAVWEAAVGAPGWGGPAVWVHGDLMPGNLLVTPRGRLAGVIDFPTAGLGDPACDLIVAWNLLPAGARAVFREAVGVDEATWVRGRARALSMALIALPYYRDTNPVMAANARQTIDEVLAGR